MRVRDHWDPAAWREVLDAIGEAVIVTDLDGIITFWNSAAERLYGWSADDVLGRNVVEITPSTASREDAEEIMARLTEGQTWHGRFQVQRRGGDLFPALVTDSPLLDERGELVGIVGVSVDLTDQLRSEAYAREGRQHAAIAALARAGLEALDLDVILQQAVAVVAAELKAPITLIGERRRDDLAVRASLGWDADPGLGDIIPANLPHDVSSPGTASTFEDLERLPAAGRPDFLADRGIRSGVSVEIGGRAGGFGLLAVYSKLPRRFGLEELSFLETVSGVIAGVVARIGVEAELRRVVEQLRSSEDVRLAFLRATSHELRTPLAAIKGFSELLLLRDAEVTPEQRTEYLSVLGANAHRLDDLIADLLDVDRLTSGLIEASLRWCSLDQVVSGALDDIDHPHHRLDARLEPVSLPLDVPKIERVVHNLVVNAIRHTPEGGSVKVSLRPTPTGGELRVEDEGSGIDPEFLERIFEPFVQGPDQRASASPGTGLGLTLVSEIVGLHGGTIKAENRPDGGACFIVELPGSDLTLVSDEDALAAEAPGTGTA